MRAASIVSATLCLAFQGVWLLGLLFEVNNSSYGNNLVAALVLGSASLVPGFAIIVAAVVNRLSPVMTVLSAAVATLVQLLAAYILVGAGRWW